MSTDITPSFVRHLIVNPLFRSFVGTSGSGTASFGTLTGVPSDNIALQTVLDTKASKFTLNNLSGTSWNIGTQPFVEKTLSANTNITVTGGTNGQTTAVLLVTNGASYTLTINGVDKAIRSSADTAITVLKKSNGAYYVSSDYIITGLTQLATPTLTATVISDTEIDLSWTNVANESSYALYWSPNGSSSWTQIGGTIAANTTSYNHTGLTASTHYYYRIKAVGDGVTYSDSNYGTDDDDTTSASGPSLENLAFVPGATSFSDIGGNVWQGDSSNWGPSWLSFARATKKIASGQDGYIEMLYNGVNNQEVILGFESTSSGGSYGGMDFGGYITGDGTLSKLISGTPSTSSFTPTFGAGTYIRISRTSGSIKLQYRSGGTVTDVDVLGSYSGDIFPYCVTNGDAEINNPQGYNLS